MIAQQGKNTNPAGNPRIGAIESVLIKEPSQDVKDKQDPTHTEADLMGDLAKVTQRLKKS